MVEIDPETYGCALTCYVVAEDCGRLINPMIVDGQVHGAAQRRASAPLSTRKSSMTGPASA